VTPRYAFVGGLHRSGTSVLTRCIAAHPRVTSFTSTSVWEDEGQHLQDVLPPARVLGGPGAFARHPAARSPRTDPGRAAEIRRRLLATWEPLWATGREVRLAKSPPNLLRGPLLQQVFPGACLLVIRRHPLAVALATRRMSRRLRGLGIGDLVEHWVLAHEAFAEDLPVLEKVLVIEHHDLVTRPGCELGRVFAALGLDPVAPVEPLTDSDAPYRAAWGALTRGAGLPASEVTRLEELAPRVRALGYSLRGFETVSSPTRPSFPPR
jgi:hypothetical protein